MTSQILKSISYDTQQSIYVEYPKRKNRSITERFLLAIFSDHIDFYAIDITDTRPKTSTKVKISPNIYNLSMLEVFLKDYTKK